MVKNMDCRVELLGLKSGFCYLPVPQFPHLRNGCNGAVVRFEEVLSTEADTQYLKKYNFFNPNSSCWFQFLTILWISSLCHDEQTKAWKKLSPSCFVIQCIVSNLRLCFKSWASIVSCSLVNSLSRLGFFCFMFFVFCSLAIFCNSGAMNAYP